MLGTGKVKKRAKQDSAALKISDCAAKYAVAIVDPWDRFASGACVPAPPSRPSYKVRGFTRGILNLSGTSGVGFIALSPALCNDFAQIWYTDSNFTGTAITATMTATPGVNPAGIANLPFSRAQLTTLDANNNAAVQGRIVSAGIAIKYIGTELNRGGRIICYSDPGHGSINGATSASLGSKLEAEFSTPGPQRSKCWIVANAIDSTELSYADSDTSDPGAEATIKLVYPFSQGEPLSNTAGDLNYGQPIMGAVITGVKGDAYEFEVILHVEYIGAAAQSQLTPNMSDPDGLALVQTAIGRSREERVANPTMSLRKAFKKEIVKAAREMSMSSLIRGGATLLGIL